MGRPAKGIGGLGRALYTIRKVREMKQKDFGKIMGISDSMVAAVESGERELSLEALENISKEFKVKIEDLINFSREIYKLEKEIKGLTLDLINKKQNT